MNQLVSDRFSLQKTSYDSALDQSLLVKRKTYGLVPRAAGERRPDPGGQRVQGETSTGSPCHFFVGEK